MSCSFSWSLNLRTRPYREFAPHSLVALGAKQLLPKTLLEKKILLPIGLSRWLRIRLWIWFSV
jgi:hypothetical protein